MIARPRPALLLAGLVLVAGSTACNRGDRAAAAKTKKRPTLEQALADAHARAPNPSDSVEMQARVLLANLRLARRQMVQTTDGPAERLPNEVVKLAHMGRRIIPLVTAELADPEADTRYFMMQVLAEIADHREQDEFIRALADTDPGVVRVASEALGHNRDAETVPLLFQAMEQGRIRQIRWGAVLTPAKPFDHDQIPYLIRRLADERSEIRISASIALNRITSQDFGFDPDGNDKDRQRAVMRWENWWTDTGRAQPSVSAPPKPPPGPGLALDTPLH